MADKECGLRQGILQQSSDETGLTVGEDVGLGEFGLSTYVGEAMWAARETQDAVSARRVGVRSGCSLGCEWTRAVAGGEGFGWVGGSLHPQGSELPAPQAQCQ